MTKLLRLAIGLTAIGAILVARLPAQASDNGLPDYILLEDYLEQHPIQRAISAEFSQLIKRPAASPPVKSKHPPKIFVVYPGLQMSDYWRRSISSFRARLDEMGIPYEIDSHFTKPGTQLRLQSALINQAVANAPDYMIFTLDALRHRGMIERVVARSKTKVILQNITTPITAFEDSPPFFYVGFDHGVGAKILADRYKAEMPGGARYAILYGPQGYVSALRGGIFRREMSTHPNTKVIAEYYVNFDRRKAYEATFEILRTHEEIDFIYACSTDIAHGIADALKEAGMQDKVIVNGWGGGASELAAIKRGEFAFTVMRMNDDNGVAMAEAIRLDLEGVASARVPTVFSGEFKLIDRSTSDAELAELKAYAFRYSK